MKKILMVFMLSLCMVASMGMSSFAVSTLTETEVEDNLTTAQTTFIEDNFKVYAEGDLFDLQTVVRPVSTVYITSENVSADTLAARFGGKWTRIENKFLWAGNNSTGQYGGYYSVTLGAVPYHTHASSAAHTHSTLFSNDAQGGTPHDQLLTNTNTDANGSSFTTGAATGTSGKAGGSGSHPNMPPYRSVRVHYRYQ